MSLEQYVKLAYQLGCRMAISDMEKVSVPLSDFTADILGAQIGLGLGEIAGQRGSRLLSGSPELAEALSYLGAGAGGFLGNRAAQSLFSDSDTFSHRQGNPSLAAQIGTYLGAKGLGAGRGTKMVSSGLAGVLAEMVDSGAIKYVPPK